VNWCGLELVCPRCRGDLAEVGSSPPALVCPTCGSYPVIHGIPDLRVFPDPYIDLELDRAKAVALAERFTDFDFPRFVGHYYRNTAAVPPADAARFTRSLMGASARAEVALAGWEGRAGDDRHRPLDLLEIGCGTGPVLVAARAAGDRYRVVAGIDIALRWLVVAQRRLADEKVSIPLICACGEALPFADAGFDRVVADSMLEHASDQSRVLSEAYRVLRPGGRLFLATPNRRSVGPDPHTGLWGGSWLPASWSAAYVRRKGGIPPKRRLLSESELRGLVARAGFREASVFTPTVPGGQRAHLSAGLRLLAAAYSAMRTVPGMDALLRWAGPMLHLVARRDAAGAETEP
jgi:SAM-dependent methyltransferase/uncharacterized protein YbaR (Trm112 family)